MNDLLTTQNVRESMGRIDQALSLVLQAIQTLRNGDTGNSLHSRYSAPQSLENAREQLEKDRDDWQSEIDRSDCPRGVAYTSCALRDPCREHRDSEGNHA